MSDPYIRNAKVVRVVDGDTVVLNIDLGFSLKIEQVVRLYGINTPEMVGESRNAGMLAKAYMYGMIPPMSDVTVKTIKPNDKYGRYLAEIYQIGDPVSVNQKMITAGHAIPYMV